MLISFLCFSQQETKLSLLTFEPGTEAYSIFGHTAIRVYNPFEETDLVYNFGMFDFDAPNFLLKFSGGRLDYKLGIEDFTPTLQAYSYDKRQVWEQLLNFNEAQTKEIVEKLEYLYRPENRYYRYGFLQRNCSTEIRDLLLETVEGVEYSPTETGSTYRDYINDYAKVTPWFRFGINLALGSPIDYEINTYELMFLPDFLSREMEKAKVNGKPVAEPQEKLLGTFEKENASKWQLTPFIIFCIVFVILVLGRSRFLIQTFTICVGIGGLIILALMLFSAHAEVQNNYNLLWCNPLYFVSFVLCFTDKIKFHKIFAAIMLLGVLATFAVWILKIQGFDWAFLPICLTLIWINIKQMQRKYKMKEVEVEKENANEYEKYN